MPSRSISDLRHETLQIKQEPKLYSRLLTRDSSVANASFRVYYGGATGAVPFVWESQPGTPKSSITTTTLPPLTPPPSYHFSPSHNKGFTSATKKSPKSTLIHTFLPRLTIRKTNSPPPPSPPVFSLSSPSVSSSSSSFSPVGSAGSRHRSRFSSSRSSFSSEDSDDESPTCAMCFGMRHGDAGGRIRGCYSVVIMKNALLSIVGHGSSHDTA